MTPREKAWDRAHELADQCGEILDGASHEEALIACECLAYSLLMTMDPGARSYALRAFLENVTKCVMASSIELFTATDDGEKN